MTRKVAVAHFGGLPLACLMKKQQGVWFSLAYLGNPALVLRAVSLQKGLNSGNILIRLPKEDGGDASCASGYPSMHGSESVEHSFPQQWKASLPISLPFDEFELGDMALHYAVIDPPGKPGPHRLFVFLDSCGKGLQFRDAALPHLL